jgi:hypothetical protein
MNKTYVPSDTASFRVSMLVSKPKSEDALDDAARRIQVLAKLLQNYGSAVRLVGPDFKIVPYFALHESKDEGLTQVTHPSKLQGYTAQVSYVVEVNDMKILSDLMSKISESGIDGFDHLKFELRKDNEAVQAAYAEALRQAKARADAYAATTGVKIGRLLRIDEGRIETKLRDYGEEEIIVTARRMEERVGSMPASVKLPSEPPLQEVEVQIGAVYEIGG